MSVKKDEKRRELRRLRAALPQPRRAREGRAVFERFVLLEEYRRCKTLLIYVSIQDEMDTRSIIRHALAAGKSVAVPRCAAASDTMAFYTIPSLSVLLPSRFGLLEPDVSACRETGTDGALCVVPGLGFDSGGGRLGYGRGFYDRFLEHFPGVSVGLCYAELFSRQPLPCEEHDRSVDIVVTEQGVFRCRRPPEMNIKKEKEAKTGENRRKRLKIGKDTV